MLNQVQHIFKLPFYCFFSFFVVVFIYLFIVLFGVLNKGKEPECSDTKAAVRVRLVSLG